MIAERFISALKQAFCQHRATESRHEIKFDSNGAPYIYGKTRCLNCGKGVYGNPLDYDTACRMLNEARKQRDATSGGRVSDGR